MLVKDESARIERCIDSVRNYVDEYFITDTGSSDGTPELLKQKYGISVRAGQLEESRCLCKQDLRNINFSMVKTDWILVLDADETVVGDIVKGISFLEQSAQRYDGGFALWRNELPEGVSFNDYKLFLFKKNFRSRGLIHDNAQLDIREKGGDAVWLDQFWVRHCPEPSRLSEKRDLYMRRLKCAIAQEPEWFRYYWFMGYMNFLAGDFDVAEINLKKCGFSDSNLFPVERLNSLMVLTDIYSRMNNRSKIKETLDFASGLFNDVRHDFEVKVNPTLGTWFRDAMNHLVNDDIAKIRANRFGS